MYEIILYGDQIARMSFFMPYGPLVNYFLSSYYYIFILGHPVLQYWP